MSSVEKFDLEIVHDSFEKSLLGDEDIILDQYLRGFHELMKFFQLMGSVFGFVSSDVKSKMEILEEYRKKENSDKFETFHTMMSYEKNEGLLKKSDYVSGSRTLLRLHRGLNFLRDFFEKIGTIEPTAKTCSICQASYNATLAQYHPWLVRKGALLAMHVLPTRDDLLKKICVDVDKAIKALPDAIKVLEKVYDRTENLYTVFDLHSLP